MRLPSAAGAGGDHAVTARREAMTTPTAAHMPGKQKRMPLALGTRAPMSRATAALTALVCTLVYQAAAQDCMDQMSTNYAPTATAADNANCIYSCNEVFVYFKTLGGLDVTAFPPSCTVATTDGAGATISIGASANEAIIGQPDLTAFSRRVEVRAGGYAAMRYLTISSLTAADPTEGGGAILAVDSNVYIELCAVEDNSGNNGNGGAIALHQSTIVIIDSSFSRNAAAGDGNGGAISGVDSHLRIEDSSFDQNSAGQSGGGVWLHYTAPIAGTVIELRYTTFTSNVAGLNAGDELYISGAPSWTAVNVTYTPWNGLETVHTQVRSTRPHTA